MDRNGLTSGRTTASPTKYSAFDNMSMSQQPTSSSAGSAIFRRPIKTALHQAVLDCRLHQVRLLVAKHNVNVDCKDLHGRTPMMLACMIDEEFGYRMAKIFLSAGAFLNLRDQLGRTALSYACMNGRSSIVGLIVKEDVLDINEADNDGNTPLHHAACSGNPAIVEMLVDCFVKFGLDIDTRNSLGYTSLLLALKKGHFVSAHILLKKGSASPSLRDNEVFLNAGEWAQRGGQDSSVKYTPRRVLAPLPVSATTLSFSRESSMYQPSLTQSCNHGKKHNDRLPWSATSLSFPSMLSSQEFQRSETFIEGMDARQLVLDEIDDFESQQRPVSYRKGRIPHPSTAKLLALNRRAKPSVVPDMATIFRIYSDQYQPEWMKRPALSKSILELSTPTSSQQSHSGSTIVDACS